MVIFVLEPIKLSTLSPEPTTTPVCVQSTIIELELFEYA